MKISRVIIKNYRNLKDVDVQLENLVTLVGENNSGKSNFLNAIVLPLVSEDGGRSKRLSWDDINRDAKNHYYRFLADNRNEICGGTVDLFVFAEHIPAVSVTLEIEPNDSEHYDLKDLCSEIRDGKLIASIQYLYQIEKPQDLLERVKVLLAKDADIDEIKMSLLPVDLYSYCVTVPGKGSNVAYDIQSRFCYVALPAERDSFAANANRLGSKALIDILQDKLTPSAQTDIEKEYAKFFETIKKAGDLDEILNWQDYTDIPNAREFFDEISILPNVPPMNSILGSIKLGYSDDSLYLQGLGYRNLILMMVMLNSYLQKERDASLRLVTVEEPEAHLCINNVLLMASFFNIFGKKNTYTQLVYSTHNSELVNKVGLDKVIILHNGSAYSLKKEMEDTERDYLANNPNTDIFKLLFSKRLILVEGITEELLIKSYLQTRPDLNEIKVVAFHKGYKSIIKIWKKINVGTGNRLGVVRDSDDQPKAQQAHEAMQDEQVMVKTTSEVTLEPEIVKAGTNSNLLKEKYGSVYGWTDMTSDELQKNWRERKTDVILRICHDLVNGELLDFTMPAHIQEIIDFMQMGSVGQVVNNEN